MMRWFLSPGFCKKSNMKLQTKQLVCNLLLQSAVFIREMEKE